MDEMIQEGAEGLGINYLMVVAVSVALLVVALGLLQLVKRLFRKRLHPVVDKVIHPLALPAREFYETRWTRKWGKRKGWTIFDAWENHDDCAGDCINPSVWSSKLRAALLSILKRLSGALKTPSQDFRDIVLLSIGSGVATVEGLLRADGFQNIIALDNMPQAVEIAHHKGLKTVQADGVKLPLKDESVKLAYLDASLGHLVKSYEPPYEYPYHAALIEVRRVLAEDGVLVLVDNPLEEWQPPYVVDQFVQMLRVRTSEMLAELDNAGFEILGREALKGVWNSNPDFVDYPRPNRTAAGKDYTYYVRRIILARKQAAGQTGPQH